MTDGLDNPGTKVAPSPVYLLALLLELLMDTKAHVPLLPRRVPCVVGWPPVGGDLAQGPSDDA